MPDPNSRGRRESDRDRAERARAEAASWRPMGGNPPARRPNAVGRRQSPGPVPTPKRGGILRAIFGSKSNGKRR